MMRKEVRASSSSRQSSNIRKIFSTDRLVRHGSELLKQVVQLPSLAAFMRPVHLGTQFNDRHGSVRWMVGLFQPKLFYDYISRGPLQCRFSYESIILRTSTEHAHFFKSYTLIPNGSPCSEPHLLIPQTWQPLPRSLLISKIKQLTVEEKMREPKDYYKLNGYLKSGTPFSGTR